MHADLHDELDHRLRADAAAWRNSPEREATTPYELVSVDSAPRRRDRHPLRGARLAIAASVAVVLAVTGSSLARWKSTPTGHPAVKAVKAVKASSNGPGLVDTEWELVSYQNPGDAGPTAVNTVSPIYGLPSISFNGKGKFFGAACGGIEGKAVIDGDKIALDASESSGWSCRGARGALDRQLRAALLGSVRWSISAARILTLTNPDGHVLTFRLRPPFYRDQNARTIVAGERAGGQWRLAVGGPTGADHHFYSAFEYRTVFAGPFDSGGVTSPTPTDCLADTVFGAGSLGGQTFLLAWATPRVAKVTVQATKGAPELPLELYTVAGSSSRIAAIWAPAAFRVRKSAVRFYDKNNHIISSSPKGC